MMDFRGVGLNAIDPRGGRTFPRCYSTETLDGPLGKPIVKKVYTDCEGSVSVSGYPDAGFAP